MQVRFVEHTEIKDNSWDLNLGRYLKTTVAQGVNVETALVELAEAQAALREAEDVGPACTDPDDSALSC